MEEVKKSRPESAVLHHECCSALAFAEPEFADLKRCVWKFGVVWQAGAAGRVLNPLHSTSKT